MVLCFFRDGVCVLETDIKGEDLSLTVDAYPWFGVFANTLFKEAGFPLKAYCLHPVKWVPNFVVTPASKGNEQSISTEFDVITS